MVHCWVICLLQLPSPVLLDVHRWCIGLPVLYGCPVMSAYTFLCSAESAKDCRV